MLTETLDPFFTDFGQPATVGGVEVSVIFDAAFSTSNVGPYGMASAAPRVTLATAKVPSDPVGQPVIVGGSTYTITQHEPDGTGVSMLSLELA